MGRYGLNADGVDEASDRPIRHKQDNQTGFAGLLAILILIASGVLFYLALETGSQAVSCMFSSSGAGQGIKTSMVFFLCGILSLIVSVAFGGASLVTGQQGILGALSIGLVMLPALLLLASLLFGFSLDFSSLMGSHVLPGASSGMGTQCS